MAALSEDDINALNPWPCSIQSVPLDLSDGLTFGDYNPFGSQQQNPNTPFSRGGSGDFQPRQPAMNGRGGGGPQGARNIVLIKNLFRQLNVILGGGGWALLDILPVGSVMEWVGTKAALTAATSKWKIMDGTQGGSGQNRQGRFNRGSSGVGAVGAGSVGGANTHDHGGYTGQAGAHSHNSATGSAGSHDHGGTMAADVCLDSSSLNVAADCYASSAYVWGFDTQNETFGSHSHAIYTDGNHAHSIDSETDHCHSISSADNIPEYVETHWIEKVA